ncbi:hypothetical protein K0M31_009910 [Melipona bicolor]|uniref:Uncharacterized protein n=1 Tax=Melipona bicolor TaxID=60889 RepID=A0AA40FNF4_9HYME|nr:hypothetical protein K0M31_009910 [Melipona bicolor]
MAYLEILCAIMAILLAFCYFSTSAFGFWKNRRIPGQKPVFFFGNSSVSVQGVSGIQKRADVRAVHEKIMSDSCSKRSGTTQGRQEPLSAQIINLDPERWRPLRAHLHPLFSVAKIKSMFDLVLECADQLEKCVDQLVARDEPIDCSEISAKFTTDVIASCVFGIGANSMSDESSEFRRIGKLICDLKEFENVARLRMRLYVRKLYELLGYVVPEKRFTAFFTRIVLDAMKYRKNHNIYRPDFIQMLMELKEHPEKMGDNKLTDSLLVAQVFGFFVAGFETSSTTMTNAHYELALNPNIQDKLRQKINEYFAKHNGEFKYENMKEMKYFDKVYKETLRKYPPIGLLPRRSICPYTFRNTKLTIPKRLML